MAYVEGGDSHESRKQHDFLFGVSGRSIPAQEPDLPKWIWGVAANVKAYRNGVDLGQLEGARSGAKHFASGSHVWVAESSWLWDGRVTVVGKRKGTHRYIRKVMDLRLLENFRAKRIYSPTVISWMRGERSMIPNYGDSGRYWAHGNLFYGMWLNRKEAESLAELLNKMDVGDDQAADVRAPVFGDATYEQGRS